jgi:23S rRNA (adenine2030-N6)-methyltransferase
MNYRHAFHAGNFADVLKHAVLALVIEHLKRKPAAFRVIDTHAGAGLYRLDGEEARRTGEWRDGIGRLLGPGAAPLPDEVAPILAPYLDAVRRADPAGALACYPGSPVLALAMLRRDDRLIANELHAEDAAALRTAIGHDGRAKVMTIDGWLAVRALLPPRERRGLVLIDPPFEADGDLERLKAALFEAVARFATGVYLLWLPIKDTAEIALFCREIAGAGYGKLLFAELCVREPGSWSKLAGTGLVVLNPPFTLKTQLDVLLPFLAERLAQGPGARARAAWLGGEDAGSGRPRRR